MFSHNGSRWGVFFSLVDGSQRILQTKGGLSGHLLLSTDKEAPAHGSDLAHARSHGYLVSKHSVKPLRLYDFTSPLLDIESNGTHDNRRQQAFLIKDERANPFRFAGFSYSNTALPSQQPQIIHKVMRTGLFQ